LKIVGLILAGGDARRLGGIDKTLLPVAGKPILSHLIDRLSTQLDTLALGANGDPGRFAAFGLPVIADEMIGIGPLGGLARGFGWAGGQGADMLLTVPGDTPFVPRDLLKRLSPGPAVACSADRTHHLVALWPVAWGEALSNYLAGLEWDAPKRAYGARAFAERFGMRKVAFPTGAVDPFFNVNAPSDLAALPERLS
jgi:molybdopterin-guanine dinucleotide biosynthesis protein A